MTLDPGWGAGRPELDEFVEGAVIQLTTGHPAEPSASVTRLGSAAISLTRSGVAARLGTTTWSWIFADLEAVFHGGDEPWTILAVPGVADHGVAVAPHDVDRFRSSLHRLIPGSTAVHDRAREANAVPQVQADPELLPPAELDWSTADVDHTETRVLPIGGPGVDRPRVERVAPRVASPAAMPPPSLAGIEACGISAWFGSHHVLDRVSLDMAAGQVTALIGPSGCGKSTFLRILNRMHELIPSAAFAGEVLLDGDDIYEPGRKVTDARRQIGMVFQKPNPFPAMSIYDNVVASFQLTGTKVTSSAKDEVVESCLRKAGLWNEVCDRLRQPGGSLSGGQQQRLCIARALAIRPRVLLMDEPCSALDPTSTRRIEQTIAELAAEVTIVIVTHNMQQAARVSSSCAFFLAEQGTPGVIVEHGPTEAMFSSPQDQRTSDYVNGRFG